MRARLKLADIRKIQILGDQETSLMLGRLPDIVIRPPCETFFPYGLDVMRPSAEFNGDLSRQILIELYFH